MTPATPSLIPICEIFGGLVLGCIETKFCNQIRIFSGFSRSTVAPIGRKKSASTFLLPKKKIHLAESCGCGALAANVGPPGRPWGYQRLTFGQPTVNLRSTFGQRSVSSLAISDRFSLILQVSSIETEDKRTGICKMVDFQKGNGIFGSVGGLEPSGSPWRKKKKRKPNVFTRLPHLCTAPISNF